MAGNLIPQLTPHLPKDEGYLTQTHIDWFERELARRAQYDVPGETKQENVERRQKLREYSGRHIVGQMFMSIEGVN